MTTQTLDTASETERIDDADETASTPMKTAKAEKDAQLSVLRKTWRQLTPKRSGDGLPIVLWAGFLRLVVLIADYLVAFVTATVVIPTFAVWLHRQSGAGSGHLTMAGTIAMWLTPLVFLVAILAAGEIAVMHAMWRWGTRMIQRIRDRRADESGATVSSVPSVRSRKPASRVGRPGPARAWRRDFPGDLLPRSGREG
jgi:hypothetical protein